MAHAMPVEVGRIAADVVARFSFLCDSVTAVGLQAIATGADQLELGGV